MEKGTDACGTPPAPPAGLLPPPGSKQADQGSKGNCPMLPPPPAPGSGSNSGS
jgi:hypothetical protein